MTLFGHLGLCEPGHMNTDDNQISTVILQLFYGPSMFFAKLSVFMVYLRTFGPKTWFRYLTYFGIAINLALYIATTTCFGYFCIRRPGETWVESKSSQRCLNISPIVKMIHGIFGIVSDLFIFILPLPVIWKLQMPLRRKIGVSAIFATGAV